MDIEQMLKEAHESMNYTLISYRNPKIDTWTLPQPLQGVGEEAEKQFIIGTKRAILLGQVPEANFGMEAYVIGTFADGTGKIDVLPQPRLLTVITRPDQTNIKEDSTNA